MLTFVHSCHLLFDHFQFALIHGPDIPGSYAIFLSTALDLASVLVLTLSNAASASLFSPRLLVVDVSIWATSPLAGEVKSEGFVYLFIYFSSQLCCPLRFQNSPQTCQWEGFLVFGNFSSVMTPSLELISIPNSFVSLFIFYILSYLLSKTMGCLSGRLVSSASVQKLFCGICSAFKFSSEKAMAPHSSTLAWKIPWMNEPGWLQSMESLRPRTWLRDFPFTFHFHALEKEMATHFSVIAWRIPGTWEPGGLPSMGSHRVGHDWSDLAAAVKCSFDEFVGEKVVSPSYSSAILGPPPLFPYL